LHLSFVYFGAYLVLFCKRPTDWLRDIVPEGEAPLAQHTQRARRGQRQQRDHETPSLLSRLFWHLG
jgi:hypothetical protein